MAMSLTLEQLLSKSATKIATLQEPLRTGCAALIELAYNRGVMPIITQGMRTYAEQDVLYAQGRTKPGTIVTNARGGYSNHNFGFAADFALLLPDGRTVSWDTLRDDDKDSLPDWSEVVDQIRRLGFGWGGDWLSFKDMPHFEMTFGLTTAQYRAGSRPSAAKVAAAVTKIKTILKEERTMIEDLNKRLTAAEQAIAVLTNSKDVLKQVVTEQGASIAKVADRVTKLEDRGSLEHVPPWAQSAVDAAMAAGLINMPEGGSQDFYRVLTVLQRAGLLAAGKEA